MIGIQKLLGAGLIGAGVLGYWTLLSSYSQLIGRFPFRGLTSEKVIALTFDDGPNEPYTSQIADFLEAQGIRATFFQVGMCAERFPAVTARLARQGHVIGNHSYSHRLLRCLGPDARRMETGKAQQVLTRISGQTPALYRPPWLLRTPALFAELRTHRLQPISGEFCHAFEVFQPTAERIARRALAKARPGAVLIFHDGFDARGGNRASTVAATKILVRQLTSSGYRFVTVDELLGIPAYQSESVDPVPADQKAPRGGPRSVSAERE